MAKISRDSTFGEVLKQSPKSGEVMMKHGLHCIGCHMSASETIEQGCTAHGMSKKQIDDLLKELNKQ